jgi:hypothetical protein
MEIEQGWIDWSNGDEALMWQDADMCRCGYCRCDRDWLNRKIAAIQRNAFLAGVRVGLEVMKPEGA